MIKYVGQMKVYLTLKEDAMQKLLILRRVFNLKYITQSNMAQLLKMLAFIQIQEV